MREKSVLRIDYQPGLDIEHVVLAHVVVVQKCSLLLLIQ